MKEGCRGKSISAFRMSSPYATVEDPAALWYENSVYISTHLAALGYGVHMSIFAIVVYYTIQRRKIEKDWLGSLTFNSTLFILATINIGCSIAFSQSAWILEREYPGGPIHFLVEQQPRLVVTLGNTSSILASFLVDGLLLYRAIVIWEYTWYVIVVPILFYITCIVFGILVVTQIAAPSIVPLPNIGMPVWVMLMLINILLSSLIACRILLLRRQIKGSLGTEYTKAYTGVAALVIETALPFTILSIILLVLFGGKNTASNLFIPLLVQVECIAPELILLRVILHRSWSNNPVPKSNSLQFATPNRARPETPITGIWVRTQAYTHDQTSTDVSDGETALNSPVEKQNIDFQSSKSRVGCAV